MLMAETEYKHQVETDIRPFHDVLLGLFFITIGMKLDWRPVAVQWPLVLAADHGAGAVQARAGGALAAGWAPAAAWRCAPACTWRRRASSASCC
jgi:CPA2 family monovalent cation:H+ antiporter-2